MGSNSYKMQIMLPLWMALGLNLPGCDSDVEYETKRNPTPLTQPTTEETGSIIERMIYPESSEEKELSIHNGGRVVIAVSAAFTIVIGIFPSLLVDLAKDAIPILVGG